MAFAYRDNDGILHVVDDQATAKEYATGQVVETSIQHAGGYPQVATENGFVDVIDYGKEVYLNGNRSTGTRVAKDNAILAPLQPIYNVLG